MTGFVLHKGKGQKVRVASMCEDITYAQAEVLHLAEVEKKRSFDPLLIGFPSQTPGITVQSFLKGYVGRKEELDNVLALRARILAEGFESLTQGPSKEVMDGGNKNTPVLLGRSMHEFAVGMTLAKEDGKTGDSDDILEFVRDAHANPLHAGVHPDFKASVMDADWISDASKAIRRFTPERWLRRLLVVLRFYFRGQPQVPLPHNNDRCPCGSTRKYGKCCGRGVEHEDPEDCKLGKHDYSSWEKIGDKYVRNCERCYRVYDAPWFEESTFEGIKITILGCQACGLKPTPEDIHNEIARSLVWQSCGVCGKPFVLETMFIEHDFSNGKHKDRWIATHITHKEDAADLESKALGKGIFLHKECFMKAIPSWPTVARPLGEDCKRDIVREISPGAKP